MAYHPEEKVVSGDECRVDKPIETKKRALTLNDLSPAFFILSIGLSLSTFCFVIEILSKYVLIWNTKRVDIMDTSQSLQQSYESRPEMGRVETSVDTDPTAFTPQCEAVGEETGDGDAHWIVMPVAGTDEMQGEGVLRDTDHVETRATADPTAFSPQCKSLEGETGDGVSHWIVVPVDGSYEMQEEEVHYFTLD